MPRTIQLAASLPAPPDRLFEMYGGCIELAHGNVVDGDFAGVSHGWETYDWSPWRAYLTGR